MTEYELYKACSTGTIGDRLVNYGLIGVTEQSSVLYELYKNLPEDVRANCNKSNVAEIMLPYVDDYIAMRNRLTSEQKTDIHTDKESLLKRCHSIPEVRGMFASRNITDSRLIDNLIVRMYDMVPEGAKMEYKGREDRIIMEYMDACLSILNEEGYFSNNTQSIMTEQELYKACRSNPDLQAKLLAKGVLETKDQSAILYAVYCSLPDETKISCNSNNAAETLFPYIDVYLGTYQNPDRNRVAHAVNTPKDRMCDAYEFLVSNEFTSKLENSGITSKQERFQIVGCVLTFTQNHGYGQSEGLPKLKKVLYDWLDRKPMNRVDLWVWLLANFYDAGRLKSMILDE